MYDETFVFKRVIKRAVLKLKQTNFISASRLISIRFQTVPHEVQYTQSPSGAGVTVRKNLRVRHCLTEQRLKEHFILGRERWY